MRVCQNGHTLLTYLFKKTGNSLGHGERHLTRQQSKPQWIESKVFLSAEISFSMIHLGVSRILCIFAKSKEIVYGCNV